MKDSAFNTVAVPAISIATEGNSPDFQPVVVCQAGDIPLRVLVRNISAGGVSVIMAFDASVLISLPITAQTFELPAGFSEVFVLAPKQKLHAATLGANAKVSYAVSDAFPLGAAHA